MKLQEDIDRLGCWARKWGMRFQQVKCNIMQITRKRIKKINASYIEGTVLDNVEPPPPQKKKKKKLVSQLQKLYRLRNLMVSLRTCSTKMIIVRSHFSVDLPLSWMTLLFQIRV